MSDNTSFIRDYTKTNLVEDLIRVFPKLKDSINIPRSDGTFTPGRIVLSSINFNQYAIFSIKDKLWFVQTCFYNKDDIITFKYFCIEDLIYSNFSKEEIKNINEALVKGVRGNLDLTKTSPDFHPINHNYNEFLKMFRPLPDSNPDFNPDIFLNLPHLKL
jgi:hypothetical protein